MSSTRDALVFDASVLINLLATGVEKQLVASLPERCLVSQTVVSEVRRHPRDPKNTAPLALLIEANLLEVVDLDGPSLDTFIELVSGSLETALDDGESATLSIAHHGSYAAAIDENKARRIAAQRFSALQVVRTTDILQRAAVRKQLGNHFSGAVAGALEFGRMQVPPADHKWIVEVVGTDTTGRFPSLRRSRLTLP